MRRALDVQAGWRGARIKALKAVGGPSPYAFVSVSTEGGTNLAAIGLSWKIGDKVFLRPGIGLAVHDRSSNVVYGGFRGDLGSRILFEPELGVGVRLGERVTAEASWVHVSNAGLFSRQNPGMDNIGHPSSAWASRLTDRQFQRPSIVLRPHHPVERLLVDQSELQPGFLEGQALLVGVLGDLGGIVVADLGRERGDQHQRAAHQLGDPPLVRPRARRARAR